ncbi:MAG TPA: MotA/TolQ/ExbB proton channel family protein [Thermoanaerobaculia bacterium]|nr:MotA/TolQ/ExbB proton channel family protein [Thermoanaerobaculia bacterium]
MRRLLLLVLVFVLGASWYFWGLNLLYAIEELSRFSILGLAEKDVPYLARVDLSTVTTLVIALTLLAITRGVWSLRRAAGGEPWKVWHPGLPFSSGFRNLLIQLGLLGTIFAFIVAFDDMASMTRSKEAGSPSYDPAILIAPLGTALWSTFAGIAVAFLVLPPVEALFKKALRAKEGEAHDEAEAVGSSLAALEQRARDSAAALAGLAQVETFKKVVTLGEGLGEALIRLDGAARELKPALDITREALTAVPDPVLGATEMVQSLRGDLTLHRRAVVQLNNLLEGTQRHLSVLADPRRGIGGVAEGMVGIATGLQKVAVELRTAPEAPRWPALEGSPLGRELAALRAQILRLETSLERLLREERARTSGGSGEPRRGILGTIRAWLGGGREAA